MLNFKTLIKNEYASAYDYAYDLPLKTNYSEPKIYTAKGDLKKRWYVYFSFRDPETKKLKRQTPFYGNANTFKTKEERMAVLSVYRKVIFKYLRKGFSPYEDNTNRFLDNKSSSQISLDNKQIQPVLNNPPPSIDKPKENLDVEINYMTLIEGFKFVFSIKEKTLRDSSLRSYKNHIKLFQKWLNNSFPDIKFIKDIDRKIVNQFLNAVLIEHSS